MKSHLLPLLGSVLLVPTLGIAQEQTPPATVPAPAATPAPQPPTTAEPDGSNAEARKLLTDAAAAHKKLLGLKLKVDITQSQGKERRTMSGYFWYSKPNKARVQMTYSGQTVLAVQDSKSIFVQAGKTSRVAATPGLTSVLPAWQGFPTAGGTMLAALLSGEMPVDGETLNNAGVLLTADETMDWVVAPMPLAPGVEGNLTIAFKKGSHLLHSVRLDAKSKDRELSNLTIFSNVQANPTFAKGSFTYKTAPTTVNLDDPASGGEEAGYDKRLKPGAVPIAFSAKDTKGITRSPAQYKGKVLFLDFWASWCGPCLIQMPELVALYKKYHPKGLEFLAISLDEEKAAFDAMIKEKKMTWPQIYSGKGWEAPIAVKYGVQSIPFNLLIGKNGKIIAVNLEGKALDKAVAAALKAKK